MAQGLTPWLLTLTVSDTGDLERDWTTLERAWSPFARNLGRDLHGHVRCAGPFLRPDGSLGVNFHVLVIPRSNLDVTTLLDRWCAQTGAARNAQYGEPVEHIAATAHYVTSQLWNDSLSAPARLLGSFSSTGDLGDLERWHVFESAAQGRRAVTVSRSFDSLRQQKIHTKEIAMNQETSELDSPESQNEDRIRAWSRRVAIGTSRKTNTRCATCGQLIAPGEGMVRCCWPGGGGWRHSLCTQTLGLPLTPDGDDLIKEDVW